MASFAAEIVRMSTRLHSALARLGFAWVWCIPLITGMLAVRMGQDLNWDLQNYHLYNPFSLIHDRLLHDIAPAGLQTYFNPLLDLAWYWLAHAVDPRTTAFVVGFLQGLNGLLVFFIARCVLQAENASIQLVLPLTIAGTFCIGLVAQLGNTMHDALSALFPMAALALVLASLPADDRARMPWTVLLAGLLAGIGCGLKLVTAIYALALCLAMLFLPGKFSRNFKWAFLFGLATLTGLLASTGFWAWRLWVDFGNPLFPMFNQYFEAPMAAAVAFQDLRFVPRNLLEFLFYPLFFTHNPFLVAELAYRQFSWLPAYLLVLVYLGVRAHLAFGVADSGRARKDCPAPVDPDSDDASSTRADPRALSAEAVILLAFSIVAYLLWLKLFGIYRYLIVLELILPLLTFVLARRLWSGRAAQFITLSLILIISAVNLRGVPDWGRSDWRVPFYGVEKPEDLSDDMVVILMGQPLAWLVPAIRNEAVFIQGNPNFIPGQAYIERAVERMTAAQGVRLVYDPAVTDASLTGQKLALFDLGFDPQNCRPLSAHIGSHDFDYRYCVLR